MVRGLAALALAVVASAGVAVSGATSASAVSDSAVTQAAVASVDCPYRARSDTWIRSSPGGNPVELWRKGTLKFLPSGAPVSGNWRWIATSRWAYIPAIVRDTTVACIRD